MEQNIRPQLFTANIGLAVWSRVPTLINWHHHMPADLNIW